MIMDYGSPVYVVMIGFSALLCLACWFIPKNRSERYKITFCMILALVNVVQHLAKHLLYPHLWGTKFGLTNTAYNVCATLILITPIALLSKKGFFRIFVSYVGAIAGIGAIALPVWFIGKSVETWEYFRFFVCHAILLLTSLLPVLWGMRRPRYFDFWKTAPVFFALLSAILLNDLCVVCAEQNFTPEILFEELSRLNPFGLMHPMGNFSQLDGLFAVFTPKIFLPSDDRPYYTPLLWCAVPIGIFVTVLALLLFCILDRKNLMTDCKFFKNTCSARLARIREKRRASR